MSVKRGKNQKFIIDGVEVEALVHEISVLSYREELSDIYDNNTYRVTRAKEGSISLTLFNGGTLEASVQYMDVEDDKIYLFGVLKPIEPCEEWQKAFDSTPTHKQARKYQTTEALAFKRGYEAKEGVVKKTYDNLLNRALVAEERAKSLEDDVNRLERDIKNLEEELNDIEGDYDDNE